MSELTTIAVPSLGAGGLDGERSPHFGRCDCFTLVDVVDGQVADVRILRNVAHESGGCLRPVGLLEAEGVRSIVTMGMGARPLAGFRAAGIAVHFENTSLRVGDAVRRVLDGETELFDGTRTCGDH